MGDGRYFIDKYFPPGFMWIIRLSGCGCECGGVFVGKGGVEVEVEVEVEIVRLVGLGERRLDKVRALVDEWSSFCRKGGGWVNEGREKVEWTVV